LLTRCVDNSRRRHEQPATSKRSADGATITPRHRHDGFWNFWLTIQNTTTSQVRNLFSSITVFISFPLTRAQKQEKRTSPFLYAPPDQLRAFPLQKKKTTTTTTRRKKEKEGRLEVVALAPWYRRAGASALPRLCIVSPRWHLGIDDIVAMAHERSQASEFQVKKSNQRAFVGILRAKSEKEKENTWSSSAKKYFSVHCAPKTPRSARKKSA
jgi:hypothetical protein